LTVLDGFATLTEHLPFNFISCLGFTNLSCCGIQSLHLILLILSAVHAQRSWKCCFVRSAGTTAWPVEKSRVLVSHYLVAGSFFIFIICNFYIKATFPSFHTSFFIACLYLLNCMTCLSVWMQIFYVQGSSLYAMTLIWCPCFYLIIRF